jgi:CubicO group peptidase (beta-lactamase class C family)
MRAARIEYPQNAANKPAHAAKLHMLSKGQMPMMFRYVSILAGLLLAAGATAAAPTSLADAIAHGDYPKTTSLIVMRDGRPIREEYFAGDAQTLRDTRSAMKAVTALAVGAAIEDGTLPSDQARAFSYLADLRPFANDTPDKEAITLADLMSMTSALDCDDNVDASPGNEDRMHEQQNWTRWAADLPTIAGYGRDGAWRTAWRYCTANAFLAGQVLQRATHQPVDAYIAKRLLRPLGVTGAEWPRSPAGEVMTGGGLRLRARDLAALGALLADDGRWRERQVIAKSWIDAMLTPRRASRPDQNYGYFIFQGSYKTACGPLNAWYMAGNGGSQIVILRERHIAIALTRENYNVRGTAQQSQDLIERYVLPSLTCGAETAQPDRRHL